MRSSGCHVQRNRPFVFCHGRGLGFGRDYVSYSIYQIRYNASPFSGNSAALCRARAGRANEPAVGGRGLVEFSTDITGLDMAALCALMPPKVRLLFLAQRVGHAGDLLGTGRDLHARAGKVVADRLIPPAEMLTQEGLGNGVERQTVFRPGEAVPLVGE